MTPDIFAEWLRRCGERVVRTESSWWHDGGFGVYQAFPYNWLIEPAPEELKHLFHKHRALAIRYSAPVDSRRGIPSYHVTCEEPAYGFDNLSHWARKNVRRGLKNCTVQRIPVERFVAEGWALRSDTLDRQGRETGDTFEKWSRGFLLAAELEGFEFRGALVGEKLAAFLCTFRMGECVNMISQQCHRSFLKEHVNNALSFVVTQEMLSRPGVQSIFYGLESLDAPPSVDEFKFRMGYRAKPVHQCVVFNPLAAPLVNGLSCRVLQALAGRRPANRTLSKAAGMVRVCVEGNP